MGLKLKWFRANVDIARPSFRSRTTELASPASPSSTISVNGFYVQRNFENVEDQIRPPPQTRPPTTGATSAGVRTTERVEQRQRPESTPNNVAASAPKNKAKKQTPPIPTPAQSSKLDTPNGTTVNQRQDGAVSKKSTKPKPPDVSTNETTNPIFGFLTTKRKTRSEEALAAQAKDEETSAPKGKMGGNDKNRDKSEPKKTENAKSSTVEKGETSKGGKNTAKEGAKASSKREQKAAKKTKEFIKMKDKKAPKPPETKKVKPPKLPAVDPNAPSARNPLLRYAEGAGGGRSSEFSNSPAGDISEEEFLRTGNISVKTSASKPMPVGAKMAVSRDTVIGSDDEDEYDA